MTVTRTLDENGTCFPKRYLVFYDGWSTGTVVSMSEDEARVQGFLEHKEVIEKQYGEHFISKISVLEIV